MIPGSVTNIDESTFENCSGLTSAGPIGGDYNYQFGWTESIPSNAFYKCSALTSIAIPDSITSIGYHAFYGCTNLASIVLDNVTSFGSCVFEGCSSLTSAGPIGGDYSYQFGWTERIPDKAFDGCGSLISVTIPNGITSIGYETFRGCSALRTAGPIGGDYDYQFGWTETIPDNAFRGCSALMKVTIPDSVTSIGYRVFDGCGALRTAGPIGGDYNYQFGWVEAIPDKAFQNCSSLTRVLIPNSITSIGNYAFYGCSALIGVTIPSNITSIGESAFRGCTSLMSVTIPDSVTSIGSLAFGDCSALKSAGPIGGGYSYQFGWSESIPNNAFSNCSGLTSVTISKGITSIGYSSFSGCGALSNITIPSSVIAIKNNAFFGCGSLADVYYAGKSEDWSAITGYNNIPESANIHYESTGADKSNEPAPSPTQSKSAIYFAPSNIGNIYSFLISLEVTAVIPDADDYETSDIQWTSIINGISSASAASAVSYEADGKTLRTTLTVISPGTYSVSTPDGRNASFTAVRIEVKQDNPNGINPVSPKGDPHSFYIGGAANDFLVNKTSGLCTFFYSYDSTFPEAGVASVEWVSSDGDVLAFDKKGLSSVSHAKDGKTVEKLLSRSTIDDVKVYGLSEGTATVTCTVKVGDKTFTDEETITVYSKESFNLIECCRQWVSAYETYMQEVENVLQTYTGTQDEQATIREQAERLMEADQLVTFLDVEVNEDVKKNVYYAVAEYLAQETKVNFDFSKINLDGVDVTSISASIVNKVCNLFKQVSYTCKLDSAEISITGLGGLVDFQRISYNGEYVAQLITTQDKVKEAITAFVEDLLGLEKNLVHQAYKEMAKEVFGKSLSGLIDEKVKGTLLKKFDLCGEKNLI